MHQVCIFLQGTSFVPRLSKTWLAGFLGAKSKCRVQTAILWDLQGCWKVFCDTYHGRWLWLHPQSPRLQSNHACILFNEYISPDFLSSSGSLPEADQHLQSHTAGHQQKNSYTLKRIGGCNFCLRFWSLACWMYKGDMGLCKYVTVIEDWNSCTRLKLSFESFIH